MTYYRRHTRHGSDTGKARHYLLMGPWDHPGTRTPAPEVGSVKFAKAALLDLNGLHKAWYDWFSRRLEKGSRLRLVFYSPNSRHWEKNCNSGGEGSAESRKDARTTHVTLYQDGDHPSYLEIPGVPAPGH
jgi:predicted acyl esterase